MVTEKDARKLLETNVIIETHAISGLRLNINLTIKHWKKLKLVK